MIAALLLVVPSVAVTVIVVLTLTVFGVKLYEARLAFAEMVTLVPAGIALPSELERETATPAGPAAPSKEMLAVALVPPRIDVGDTETADSTAAFTVTAAVLVTEPRVADSVTGVSLLTPVVVAVIAALVAPAGIVIAPVPTDRAGELLVIATVSPPAGAGELSVALIAAVCPP